MKKKTTIKPSRLAVAGLVILFAIFAVWLADAVGIINKSQRVPVLIYHDFWEYASDDRKGFTSIESFAAEMEYLHNNGYRVISLKKLINHMESGEALPEKAVVITFDDGYKSNYTLAYPILKKYNMPATIFLIAGYDQYPPDEIHPRLSWGEMVEMEKGGLVDIQAHTYDMHRRVYTDRDKSGRKPAMVARAYLPGEERRETPEEYEERLYNDFSKARATIEAGLNKEVDTMAWPFGVYNAKSVELARKAGFKYFATTRVGLNRQGDSIEAIRRVSGKENMPLAEFSKLIEPDYFYLRHFKQVVAGYLKYLLNNCSL